MIASEVGQRSSETIIIYIPNDEGRVNFRVYNFIIKEA
jgi:hypothetical protein